MHRVLHAAILALLYCLTACSAPRDNAALQNNRAGLTNDGGGGGGGAGGAGGM